MYFGIDVHIEWSSDLNEMWINRLFYNVKYLENLNDENNENGCYGSTIIKVCVCVCVCVRVRIEGVGGMFLVVNDYGDADAINFLLSRCDSS